MRGEGRAGAGMPVHRSLTAFAVPLAWEGWPAVLPDALEGSAKTTYLGVQGGVGFCFIWVADPVSPGLVDMINSRRFGIFNALSECGFHRRIRVLRQFLRRE